MYQTKYFTCSPLVCSLAGFVSTNLPCTALWDGMSSIVMGAPASTGVIPLAGNRKPPGKLQRSNNAMKTCSLHKTLYNNFFFGCFQCCIVTPTCILPIPRNQHCYINKVSVCTSSSWQQTAFLGITSLARKLCSRNMWIQ